MFKAETAPNEAEENKALDIVDSNDDDSDGEITREDLLGGKLSEDTTEGDDETDGEEKAESEDDAEEFEIALEGDDGSHPEQDENRGIRKRINKLNRKVEAANEGKEAASAELEIERERNRLLRLALDQQQGKTVKDANAPPDPNDYDDGIADEKFIEDHVSYVEAKALARLQAAQTQTRTEAETFKELEERQSKHYERAYSLKVPDYDETEDKAIDILGRDAVKELISNSDRAPEVLYYLGKNPSKAESLAALFKTKPVKGVLELGRLEARLVARPKSRTKPAPAPEGEQRGGGAGRRQVKRGPAGAKFE